MRQRLRSHLKRTLASTVLGFPVLLAAGAVDASAESPNDRLTGHGSIPITTVEGISVGAHSGPLGEDPNGHFRFTTTSGFTASLHVTCMTVVGNRAIVGGNDPSIVPPGNGRYLVVEDNGAEGDSANTVGSFSATPALCDELFLREFELFPVEGNLKVQDALPTP